MLGGPIMQQKRILPKKLYQTCNIDETEYSKKVFERLDKLEKIALLINEGCEESVALKAIDLSRATYYRWKRNYKLHGLMGLEDEDKRPINIRKTSWSAEVESRIYHLRKQYPLFGKQKIAIMYERKYKMHISESTTGRIISRLIKLDKIKPVNFYLYGKKDRKKRVFNNYAQRWKHGMKATKPGELIEVDHSTIHVPGSGYLKHFSATCQITKFAVYQVYQEATSKNAAEFLEHMQQKFPFPILSIQVDGGAEFMAFFEQACKKAKIPLFVLPPRSPELNGHVERSNSTAKYEFYAQYQGTPSLHLLRKKLDKFSLFYNHERPHQGIGLLTPSQFYEEISMRP
jgi:transposase InsO family protein